MRLLLRRRAWVFEVAALLVAVAIWWFFFWAPDQSRKHDALRAFDAYAATQPQQWRAGRDVVSNQDDAYLVCSRRAETDTGIAHLCLSIRTNRPKGQQVIGGYHVTTIGYDLPAGTKTDCFGAETGTCLAPSS